METVINEFPYGEPHRRFVVACYQPISLSQPSGVLVERPHPPPLLEPLWMEALLAPHKEGADVVLARTPEVETTRAWIGDAGGRSPRAIHQALLGPTATPRFRRLIDYPAQQWAMRGGLQAIEPKWQEGTWECQICEVPPGVPREYFNVAPPDQQFLSLTGDEVVWIDSSDGRTWSRLPGAEVTLWAVDVSPAELVTMTLDTIVLDPDKLEAFLFWRGTITRPAGAPSPSLELELLTSRAPMESAPHGSMHDLRPMPTAELPLDSTVDTPRFCASPVDDALPFRPAEEPIRDDATWDPAFEVTVVGPAAAVDPVLPFRSDPPPCSPSAPPAPIPAGPTAVSAAMSPVAPPAIRPTYAILESERARRPLSAPPVELGPPAPASMPEPASELPLVTEPISPVDVSIETVATLDAEMQRGAVSFSSSLAAHRLTPADLAAHQSKWEAAMIDESKRGARDLRVRYDAAFLARLEQLRGRPVSSAEYAKIAVALERSAAPEALAALDLPASALLPLSRVFAGRTAESPELRKEIREAIRRERSA